jgi:ligand-binding SRPBCC domain-containing protein
MRLQSLELHQDIPLSREEAWAFFSRPENLARITPSDLGFEVTSPVVERMYAGMIITYRVRPFAGIAVDWVTEITHVREPEFFVDEQRIGPYRFWHHQHHFMAIDNGTRMTDLVHYQLPCGWPGALLFGGVVRQRLETIFSYRQKTLRDTFGAMVVDL